MWCRVMSCRVQPSRVDDRPVSAPVRVRVRVARMRACVGARVGPEGASRARPGPAKARNEGGDENAWGEEGCKDGKRGPGGGGGGEREESPPLSPSYMEYKMGENGRGRTTKGGAERSEGAREEWSERGAPPPSGRPVH